MQKQTLTSEQTETSKKLEKWERERAAKNIVEWFDAAEQHMLSELRELRSYKARFIKACQEFNTDKESVVCKPTDPINWAVHRLMQFHTGLRVDLAMSKSIELDRHFKK